jgi:glycosyltransferase 2 family protein
MMKVEGPPRYAEQREFPPAAGGGRRKFLIFAVKLIISALLIGWIVHTEDVPAVLESLTGADRVLAAGAFLVYSATYYVRALRWQLLLRAYDIVAGIPFLVRSYLVSVFFSNFLPSTVGGDVVRVYGSWKAGATKTGALTVIFVDRFLGVLALLLFAAAALLLAPTARAAVPLITPVVLLATAAALAAVWMLFVPGAAVLRLMARLRLLPGERLRRISDPLFAALRAFHGQRRVLAATTLHSVVLQAMIVVHYILIARALGIDVPILDFFWIMPVAILIMMAPISINAIGVREHVFVYFFAAYGVPGSEAVAFAWISYGIVLVLGVLGGALNATHDGNTSPAKGPP